MYTKIVTIGRIFCFLTAFLLISTCCNTSVEIVIRSEWNAKPPKFEPRGLALPVKKVIIIHTATDSCSEKESCSRILRNIQKNHMKERSFDDIAYNFLIGGDGLVYEGRGWNYRGSHTKNGNDNSIGIAFIGNYNILVPTDNQINVTQSLILQGVRLNKISNKYNLFGHRQLRTTESPGDNLYNEIKNWDHWVDI